MGKLGGYMGKLLRVDLTEERITEEQLDEATLRKFIGGSGLGTKIMYDEVPAGIEWSDPANRLIWASGVFGGTKAPGSGTYTVVTKGPLTNFLTASQANGFFGARLKFAGYDAVVVQGMAKKWVYLYVHDGVAELRDAAHLSGKDTWDTEETIKEEIGEAQASVSCIGPAGENLVKYACVCSDRGHVASTNGCGAVMGSKKLKAIAVHGKKVVPLYDKDKFTALLKDWWKQAYEGLYGALVPTVGTCGNFLPSYHLGILPVKNLTSHDFPDIAKLDGANLRAYYQGKSRPCYACRFAHCQEMEIKSGPHKGAIIEEAEYEALAAFSCVIDNNDLDAAEWLAHLNDRLGMDAKEQAFVIGLAMECYEKRLITKDDTGGVELTWGNAEAVEAMLHKIAKRDGFGDVLAEGVMRAAQKIGGDAPKFAVYTHKGNAPHVHDPRGNWFILFNQVISDQGSVLAGDMGDVEDLLPPVAEGFLDPSKVFSAEHLPKTQAMVNRRGQFIDTLGICCFVCGARLSLLADAMSAVTGWDFTWREAADVGHRLLTLMRAFNIRHGLTRDDNSVSPRLLDPPRAGFGKGLSIGSELDKLLDGYYENSGWDKEGKPLPETLHNLGLESVSRELWG